MLNVVRSRGSRSRQQLAALLIAIGRCEGSRTRALSEIANSARRRGNVKGVPSSLQESETMNRSGSVTPRFTWSTIQPCVSPLFGLSSSSGSRKARMPIRSPDLISSAVMKASGMWNRTTSDPASSMSGSSVPRASTSARNTGCSDSVILPPFDEAIRTSRHIRGERGKFRPKRTPCLKKSKRDPKPQTRSIL